MPGQRLDASETCRPIKEHWEKRHQDRHRHNVLTAKPAVTSSWSSDPLKPQPRYGHLDYNANKAMVQEERFATIEYENSLLLGKMRRIMSVGTAATNKAFIQVEELPPRSLNEGRRRRELERITADNMSIVRRIQLCAPSYEPAVWAEDHRRLGQLRDNISRFRPASPSSATGHGYATPSTYGSSSTRRFGGVPYSAAPYSSAASPKRYDVRGAEYFSATDVMERLNTAPADVMGPRHLRPIAHSFPPYGSTSASRLSPACSASGYSSAASDTSPVGSPSPKVASRSGNRSSSHDMALRAASRAANSPASRASSSEWLKPVRQSQAAPGAAAGAAAEAGAEAVAEAEAGAEGGVGVMAQMLTVMQMVLGLGREAGLSRAGAVPGAPGAPGELGQVVQVQVEARADHRREACQVIH